MNLAEAREDVSKQMKQEMKRNGFMPNPSQEKVLDFLVNQIVYSDFLKDPNKYEIKELMMEPLGDTKTTKRILHVHVVTGMKGDEGTMAAVFARDKRHLFLYPRGRVSAYGEGSKMIEGFEALRTHCNY